MEFFGDALTVFAVLIPIPQWDWATSVWTTMVLVCVCAWVFMTVDFRRSRGPEAGRVEAAVARIKRSGLLF